MVSAPERRPQRRESKTGARRAMGPGAVGATAGVGLVVRVLVDLPVDAILEHVVAEGGEEVGEYRSTLVAVELLDLEKNRGAPELEGGHPAVGGVADRLHA